MNRKCKYFYVILVFLVLISSCQGQERKEIENYQDISYDLVYDLQGESQPENKWPNDSLRRSFASYWENRFKPIIDQTWVLEAPHVQFLGSKEGYSRYYSRMGKNNLQTIKIKDIKKSDQDTYVISFELHIGKSDNPTISEILDHWVRVDGKWYHLPKNPIIFPFMRS